MEDTSVRDSKRLSKLLRHCPERYGCTVDEHGWADLDRVVLGTGLSRERIAEVVSEGTRFEISEDGERIRAYHGHSTSVGDIQYEPVSEVPDILYHGTSEGNWAKIVEYGSIEPMGRVMVHLSDTAEKAFDVGRRHGKPVILTIDSRGMREDGFEFCLSGDGVYLTRTVPTGYVLSAESFVGQKTD